MNTLLEERYRRTLRLLPASYRAEREEEMVAAFMEVYGDVPDEANPKPRWGEIASVARLSLRVRLGGAGAGPRAVTWGESVRLIALYGLAFQAALSVLSIPGRVDALQLQNPPLSFERVLEIAGWLSTVLWVVAFASLMRGRARLAKGVAAVAVTATLLQYGWLVTNGIRWEDLLHELLWVAAVMALLAGFHRDVTPVVRSWWLVLAPLAAGGAIGLALLTLTDPDVERFGWWFGWISPSGMAALAIIVAGVATLWRRSPAISLALAMAAGLTLLTLLPSLIAMPQDAGSRLLWASVMTQGVAMACVVVVFGVVGAKLLPSQGNVGVGEAGELT